MQIIKYYVCVFSQNSEHLNAVTLSFISDFNIVITHSFYLLKCSMSYFFLIIFRAKSQFFISVYNGWLFSGHVSFTAIDTDGCTFWRISLYGNIVYRWYTVF